MFTSLGIISFGRGNSFTHYFGHPRSKHSKKKGFRPVHLLLASGGVLGTLMGGNLLSGREWVTSIVPDHQLDESLLMLNELTMPEVQPYIAPAIQMPDTTSLPKPVEHLMVELPDRVVLVGQGEAKLADGLNSGVPSEGAQSTSSLPEIPQIAVPVIPERPQVNVQSVSLDLPEIPQVQVPQPVTTSKSSK